MPGLSLHRSAQRALGHRLGLIEITCTAVLWGTGGVVVQFLHDRAGLSAVSVAFYRLAVAATVLLVVASRRRGELVAALRAEPARLAVTGLGLGAYQGLYFVAVTDVGVSVATMVSLGLAPIVITAVDAMGHRRRPSLATTATVTAAVAGLVLISAGAAPGALHPLIGLACAVGSGLAYAATTVMSQQVARTVAPLALTTVTTTAGAIALAPLALLSGLAFRAAGSSVLALAYLGPVTTAVAYGLFYLGLRTTATSTVAVLTLLEPLAAAALATAVFGNPLPATTIAGGTFLLGAVATLYIRAPATRSGDTRMSSPQARS